VARIVRGAQRLSPAWAAGERPFAG